jgi:hypothetical protein
MHPLRKDSTVKISNPLQWPSDWPRNQTVVRSRFAERSLAKAIQGLHKELLALGNVADITLTCNQPIGRSGNFLSGSPDDGDYGVAVYFKRAGRPTVMAFDAFWPVADNIWSLALAIGDLRAFERHGGAGLMDKAFVGMAALPPPKPWWEVMHLSKDTPIGVIEATYRELAKASHPDKGGSPAAWQELQSAIDTARRDK